MSATDVEERLKGLEVKLPVVSKPVVECVPAKRVGDLVYVSGQGPIRDGKPVYVGQAGSDVSPEEDYQAAKICALNCLAAIKSVVGSLDEVDCQIHRPSSSRSPAGSQSSLMNYNKSKEVMQY